MSKTILVTGIGGLTPRSITTIIKENHPDYKVIGCDVEKKAMVCITNIDTVFFFGILRPGAMIQKIKIGLSGRK